MLAVMLDVVPLLLNGFIFTVELTPIGIFGGLAIGIALAIGDLYGGRFVSAIIRVYVECFRGGPILVQLFIVRARGATAGLSVGMSKAQTILHVILPQALRIVVPSWSNEFCSLTKSTAAVALIGGFDLTAVGKTIAGLTYDVIGAYSLVAVIYLAWITAFTKVADIVYEKKKIPGIELSI
jgi:polar amino acid transport system permease protein